MCWPCASASSTALHSSVLSFASTKEGVSACVSRQKFASHLSSNVNVHHATRPYPIVNIIAEPPMASPTREAVGFLSSQKRVHATAPRGEPVSFAWPCVEMCACVCACLYACP